MSPFEYSDFEEDGHDLPDRHAAFLHDQSEAGVENKTRGLFDPRKQHQWPISNVQKSSR
jgi:hypothetical protein